MNRKLRVEHFQKSGKTSCENYTVSDHAIRLSKDRRQQCAVTIPASEAVTISRVQQTPPVFPTSVKVWYV